MTVQARKTDDGEQGYFVMVKKAKKSLYSACAYEYEWVAAGLDELNEICRRLGYEGVSKDNIVITSDCVGPSFG